MNTSLLKVILFSLQELLINAPSMFAKLQTLFSKPNVSISDIEQLRDEIDRTPYSSIVTNTKIPPDQRTK